MEGIMVEQRIRTAELIYQDVPLQSNFAATVVSALQNEVVDHGLTGDGHYFVAAQGAGMADVLPVTSYPAYTIADKKLGAPPNPASMKSSKTIFAWGFHELKHARMMTRLLRGEDRIKCVIVFLKHR